ncbi:DUF3908 family protein [Clostridium estertheticum]|uniref:DUF3908 family protein n=1 Tax=Clostridium estertheticum TaxID=238834 RepID=UPI001C0DDF3A|nr:DUF3908 family protein [Clostridium estertheticum]MBU3198165.1 DUF3908 family protein [Clostridium estertheticum]WAG65955.1 DUF3908 family protein [Clostridium estertheticum]
MLSYSELKKSFLVDSFSNMNVRRVFQRADSLVEEEEVELYYPKNLELEERSFELYLFCYDDRILKISIEEGTLISTNLLKKNNIEKVTLKENYARSYEKMLEIKFKNGENIKFDSINDTNQYSNLNLTNIIELIFKNLISCKIKNTENDGR